MNQDRYYNRFLNFLTVFAVAMAAIIVTTPTTSAQSGGASDAEKANCLLEYGASACLHAEDAGDWARGQTHRLFYIDGYEGVDGDMGNAFQHCAGAGALATRVGYDTAIAIGEDHEFYSPNAYNISQMDLLNNEIGAGIGVDAVDEGLDDTWGYVMHTCEDMARDGSLYGPCGLGEYQREEDDRLQDPGRILECPGDGNTIG